MATKYGYVQRDPQDTQLNWNQIATDVTDMLQDEVKVREEKKAAIDQATSDYQTILNNIPQGENTELNEFALNGAEKLQKQMLMQETLLKSGQLSPKQYTIMRQNLQDGTDQAFSLFQDYNDEYAEKMAMMSSDLPVGERASKIQNWLMENAESFANFSKSELVINPSTGVMSMAHLIDDGNGNMIPDPDPNKLVTVQQLRNRIKGKYTQYDVIGGAEKFVGTLGEQSQVMRELGTKYGADIFTKIEDIRTRMGGKDYSDLDPGQQEVLSQQTGVSRADMKAYNLFEKSQDTFVKGELTSNPNFGSSVLLDFVGVDENGEPYTPTFDPNDTRSNTILFKNINGRVEAQLTEDQLKRAERAYKDQIDIGLDYKETKTVSQVSKRPPKATATDYKRADKKSLQKNVMDNVAKVFYGDANQLLEAENALKSANPNIAGLDKNANNLIIEYKDGTQETIEFTAADGTPLNQEQFVKGSANFFLDAQNKIADVNKAASGMDFSKGLSDATGAVTQQEDKSVYRSSTGEDLTMDDAALEVIREESPAASELFFMDEQEKSATAVNSFLLGTGYTVETNTAGKFSGNDILELYKDGESTGVEFFLDDDPEEFGKIDEYMEKLLELKAGNLTPQEKALKAKKLKKTVKTKRNLRGGSMSKWNTP